MEFKFCKNCKYTYFMDYCDNSGTRYIDLVDGKEYIKNRVSCEYERLPNSIISLLFAGRKRCGPKGIYWEPREIAVPPKEE